MVKVQPPAARGGMFTKDDFDVDLDGGTVTCPAGQTVAIARSRDGSGVARFVGRCTDCCIQQRCTTATSGRSISVHRHEALLARARQQQQERAWQDDYRSTRPKVERKLAHMLRRGRRARRRGIERVDADWTMTGAAVNLARMATHRIRHVAAGWQTSPA